ncbi:hypothetical protein MKW98_027671 [Papaver atlanticum]|uniref:Uncharacterized protein n=1 Tax=Papaver atlanticum TaxID=357466 RepID=A0AAD4XKP4_9MAGN|nr:hypothetical protein MKW98_027671 [Papaver atlanticum]
MAGSSNGFGAETARILAMRGVQVVIAVRITAAGTTVKETILMETPSARIYVLELDLSSMASVRKFAEEFKAFSHFLLTDLLLETMKWTASQSNIEGKIINVSSEGYKLAYRESCIMEDGVEITANSLHPGAIVTNLWHNSSIVNGLVVYSMKVDLRNS